MPAMTAERARAYAETWIHDWCRRDIDALVSHYAEDPTFVTAIAARRTGRAIVEGRDALKRYWSAARSYAVFEFALDHMIWDPERSELVIGYVRNVDGRRDRACEIVCFDADGQVRDGEAMGGSEIVS